MTRAAFLDLPAHVHPPTGQVAENPDEVQEGRARREYPAKNDFDDRQRAGGTYLKTQRAPKAAIEALEGLTVEQHVSRKRVVDRIKKLLEE